MKSGKVNKPVLSLKSLSDLCVIISFKQRYVLQKILIVLYNSIAL